MEEESYPIEGSFHFDPADQNEESLRYVGPLTEQQRVQKVLGYLNKKYNRIYTQKHTYTCRQAVAEKRLRIKGRFVTRPQAFEILGLTQNQLLDNVKI